MTSDARYGYSLALAREVKAADQKQVAVRFARMCIAQNLPVAQVAKQFGVSRTAVYAWFRGRFKPSAAVEAEMQRILDRDAESA